MWVEPIIEALVRSRVSGDAVNVQIGGVESAESGALLGWGGWGSTCESQSGVFESSVDQSGKRAGWVSPQ